MAKEKKVNLKDLTYEEIVELYYTNPKIPITAGVLLETLRKFEIRLINEYGLKSKVKLLVPNKSIVKPTGEKIKSS